MDKGQKLCKNDTKGKMVISHQKWKITFLESLMNLKHERSNSKFFIFWDSFEGVWNENMQECHFWIILEEVHFWQFWLPNGILGITKNTCVFWRRLFLGKLYLTSRALKQAQDHPKLTSFDPPNVPNKLLSRNLTLTRRYEVNKFNLVTYFSLQESSSSHLFMGRFSLKFLQRNNSYLT